MLRRTKIYQIGVVSKLVLPKAQGVIVRFGDDILPQEKILTYRERSYLEVRDMFRMCMNPRIVTFFVTGAVLGCRQPSRELAEPMIDSIRKCLYSSTPKLTLEMDENCNFGHISVFNLGKGTAISHSGINTNRETFEQALIYDIREMTESISDARYMAQFPADIFPPLPLYQTGKDYDIMRVNCADEVLQWAGLPKFPTGRNPTQAFHRVLTEKVLLTLDKNERDRMLEELILMDISRDVKSVSLSAVDCRQQFEFASKTSVAEGGDILAKNVELKERMQRSREAFEAMSAKNDSSEDDDSNDQNNQM
jgi:hypothetical protein